MFLSSRLTPHLRDSGLTGLKFKYDFLKICKSCLKVLTNLKIYVGSERFIIYVNPFRVNDNVLLIRSVPMGVKTLLVLKTEKLQGDFI